MGMGMIGRALAAGIAGGTGAAAQMMGRQAIMDMEEQKMMRIEEFRSKQHRSDVAWGADFKETREQSKLDAFKAKESELYNGAAEAGPVDESTQRRLRRQAGFETGLIGMRDVETAEYQEGRNKIQDARDEAEIASRKASDARAEKRMAAADGRAATAEKKSADLNAAIENFNRMRATPNISQQMLEIANNRVIKAGGKSMLSGPAMQHVKKKTEEGITSEEVTYDEPRRIGSNDPLGLRK